MSDITTPNLAGANEAFNDLVKKINNVKDDVLAGLEVDASALASTLSPNITSLTAELRDFMPELPALPDINLQSQLSSLSGLNIGSSQYNTLLGSITDNFGTALTSAGSSLDSLVSDASSAVAGDNTLSGIVPNMELPALGGDVKLLADAIKQATEDAETEIVSSFTSNEALTNLQSTLSDAVTAAQETIETVTKTLADGAKVTTTISGGAHIVERIEV
jgi:hypothetical protein